MLLCYIYLRSECFCVKSVLLWADMKLGKRVHMGICGNFTADSNSDNDMHSNLFMNDFFSGLKEAIYYKYVQLGSEPLVGGG